MKIILSSGIAYFFYCVTISAQTISQQVFNSSGNTSATGSMELSWSVGEPIIATLSANNTIFTQGFLQPDVTTHNTGIEEINFSDIISVFPNPVHNMLYIRQNIDIIESISLYNALGKRIIDQKFSGPDLDMSQLLPGIYFINLISYNHSDIHAFKIVKY